jgi:polyphosphate kinase 2 (PPK2 family)
MGNRCSRFVARNLADSSTAKLVFPLSAKFIAPYLDQNSRPVIVAMGFIRAVLPFMFSFIGSMIGRQLTFNTYKYANYRWKPIQSVMNFHQKEGSYQDTILDPELQSIAHSVAVAIGHGVDPSETRSRLAALGFVVVGAGSGGRAVFRRHQPGSNKVFILHVTPHGPSILNEMPRYIFLERHHLYYANTPGGSDTDAAILDAAIPCEEAINGFTYSGALFKSQEWAALTTRFEEELNAYSVACKRLGTTQWQEKTGLQGPPTDLMTLKAFIRTGQSPKKVRKDKNRWKEIEAEVKKLSELVAQYQSNGRAPTRVVLYLEGLDCSGKSSTAGLICKALEESGYHVNTAQHNRPPNAEQRKKPWMDRDRFEYPEDMYEEEKDVPEYSALVWDRGPAGDFVYGNMSDLSLAEKLKKYEEFRTYDAGCRAEGVLFCKLLFVTDRDNIAATLGKRLAHKKIGQDLSAWLDANSVEHSRKGLEEIELHIDPTDFVAFNKYKENLAKFTEFARNTDNVGHVGLQADSTIGYNNPWNVVSTSKRHLARLGVLQCFHKQLKRYATSPDDRISATDKLISFFELNPIDDPVMRPMPANFVVDRDHGISVRAVFQSVLLLLLVLFYANITWKFDIEEYA